MPEQTILFTGRGDDGYTSLLGDERVAKYDLRPEAYGTVDEASALMGLARAEAGADKRTKALIMEAQRDLWLLMGELAAAPGVSLPKRLQAERTEWLEEETSKLGREFPPLTQFVIPGDTKLGALLDVARTVVRRAERHVSRLVHDGRLEAKSFSSLDGIPFEDLAARCDNLDVRGESCGRHIKPDLDPSLETSRGGGGRVGRLDEHDADQRAVGLRQAGRRNRNTGRCVRRYGDAVGWQTRKVRPFGRWR